jgi:hypothetical protein
MEQESHTQIQISSQDPMMPVAGDWRGRVLNGSAYEVRPIMKDMVVMSQWLTDP